VRRNMSGGEINSCGVLQRVCPLLISLEETAAVSRLCLPLSDTALLKRNTCACKTVVAFGSCLCAIKANLSVSPYVPGDRTLFLTILPAAKYCVSIVVTAGCFVVGSSIGNSSVYAACGSGRWDGQRSGASAPPCKHRCHSLRCAPPRRPSFPAAPFLPSTHSYMYSLRCRATRRNPACVDAGGRLRGLREHQRAAVG